MNRHKLKELLYLDFEKASSIWSQINHGWLESSELQSSDVLEEKRASAGGVKGWLNINASSTDTVSGSILRRKTLHHNLLNEIENELELREYIVDLPVDSIITHDVNNDIHDLIPTKPYIRATGQTVIEDFTRIRNICNNYNSIVEFIRRCASQDKAEMLILYRKLDAELSALSTSDSKASLGKLKAIEVIRKQIEVAGKDIVGSIDDWLIDGIVMWIDTFFHGRINFRCYPFADRPDFQIQCNLKRECFVDQDTEHLIYGYGTQPNIHLSVIGSVTSWPKVGSVEFDRLTEYKYHDPSLNIEFERAFRSLFPALENIENMVRFSRYPSITVHPIAIYRSIE